MATKPRKKRQNNEELEQTMFVVWLRNQGLRHYAIPNGGKRNLWEAVKLKRLGTVAGVPDLCLPIPSGPFHALYVEMKKPEGGIVSPAQQEWLTYLRENNYCASIANGFEEAKEIVLKYLSLEPRAA